MKVEIKGAEVVERNLQKLEKACTDLQPALEEVSPIIVQEFKANFKSAGGNLEAKWPPRKRSYSWPILQKTKKMKGAWKETPQKQDLIIENTASYAKYHHFGMAPHPVRKLVGKTQKIMKMIMDRIKKHIRNAIL